MLGYTESSCAFLKIQPIEQVSVKEESKHDDNLFAQKKILANLIVYQISRDEQYAQFIH